MSDLLDLLRTERLALDDAQDEMTRVNAQLRELKTKVRNHEKKIRDLLTDLVTDRPLFERIETTPDEPEPEPEAPSWEAIRIEQLLAGDPPGLAELLIAEELETLGAIASWLSDGDDLEDLEVPVDDQGDKFRHLTFDEVRRLRFVLLQAIEEQGLASEFPPFWVDPTLRRLIFKVEFKKPKTRAGKEPGEAMSPVYLKANNKLAAIEYADRYWGSKVSGVWEINTVSPPNGARVETVPRESYEDRRAAYAVEREAEKAETKARRKKATKPESVSA